MDRSHEHSDASTTTGDAISADFCKSNSLVSYVPAQLSSNNLDRVITHLLGQVVMQGERVNEMEKGNAARDTLIQEMQAEGAKAQLAIQQATAQSEELFVETQNSQRRVEMAEKTVKELKGSLRVLRISHESLSESNEGLCNKVSILESRCSRMEQAIESLNTRLANNDAVMTIEQVRDELKNLQTTTANLQESTVSRIQTLRTELEAAMQANQEAIGTRLGTLEGNAVSEGMRLTKLYEKFSDIDFGAFEMQINSIQGAMRDLNTAVENGQRETEDSLEKISERCDEVTLQCHSVVEQLAVRGGFVNEASDTTSSVLSLLGNKISDILSVLILFENKVHKNEESLERLEGNLASALKNNWAVRGEKAASRKPREPKEPAPPPPQAGSDGALLATKALFKCLSCNSQLNRHLNETRYRMGLEGQIPSSVIRSPRHGRAPLVAALPPSAAVLSPDAPCAPNPVFTRSDGQAPEAV